MPRIELTVADPTNIHTAEGDVGELSLLSTGLWTIEIPPLPTLNPPDHPVIARLRVFGPEGIRSEIWMDSASFADQGDRLLVMAREKELLVGVSANVGGIPTRWLLSEQGREVLGFGNLTIETAPEAVIRMLLDQGWLRPAG